MLQSKIDKIKKGSSDIEKNILLIKIIGGGVLNNMLTVPSIPKNLQFIFSRNCISKTNHFSLLRIQFNGMKLNAIFFRQHKIIIMNTFKKIVMFCNNLVSSSDPPFLPDNLWIQYRAINRDTIFLTNILLIKRSFCNTTKFSKQKK